MTLSTNRLSIVVVMTGQTIIQIHFGLTGMASACRQIRPSSRVVIPRHDQLIAMTGNTELLFFVAGVAVIRFAFGSQTVIVDKIQTVNLAIKIVALVTIQTIFFSVACCTAIFLQMCGQTVALSPVETMRCRRQLFTRGVALLAISNRLKVTVTGLALCHRRQMAAAHLFAKSNALVTGQALYILVNVRFVRENGNVGGDMGHAGWIVSVGVAKAAFGIAFIVTDKAVIMIGHQIVSRSQAFGSAVAISAFGAHLLNMQAV